MPFIKKYSFVGVGINTIIIEIDGHKYHTIFYGSSSPKTCEAFREAMPFTSKVVHVRWSGEGMWIPLGDRNFWVGHEDPTTYPSPGQILLYPGGKSETERKLIAYGCVHFASKARALAGNHFATIASDLDRLRKIGISASGRAARVFPFGNEAGT